MSTTSLPLPAILAIGIPSILLAVYACYAALIALRDLTTYPTSTDTILPGLPLPRAGAKYATSEASNASRSSTDPRVRALKPLFLRLNPTKQSPLPREFYDLPPRPSTRTGERQGPGKGSSTPSVVEIGKRVLGNVRGSGGMKRCDASFVAGERMRGEGNASMPALSPKSGSSTETTETTSGNAFAVRASLSSLAQCIALALIFGTTYLIVAPRHLAFSSKTARILMGIATSLLPVGTILVSPALGKLIGFTVESDQSQSKGVVLRAMGTGIIAVGIALLSTYTSSYALVGLTGACLIFATAFAIISLAPLARSKPGSSALDSGSWWSKLSFGRGEDEGGKIKLGDGLPKARPGWKHRDKRQTRSFFSGDLLGASTQAAPGRSNSHHDNMNNFVLSDEDADAQHFTQDEDVAETFAAAHARSRHSRAGGAYEEHESWIVGTGPRKGPKTLEEMKAGDSWLSSPSRMTENEDTGPSFSFDRSQESAASPAPERSRAAGRGDGAPGNKRGRSTHTGEESDSWVTSDNSKEQGTTMSPWSYATAEDYGPARVQSGGRVPAKLSQANSTSGFADEPSVIRNYDPADMTSASENERFSGTLDILPPLQRRARVASDSSFYSAMEYTNRSSPPHSGDQSFPRSVSDSFSEDDLGLPVPRQSQPAPDDFAVEELQGASDLSDNEEEGDERNGSRYARSPSPIGQPPAMPLPALPESGRLRRSASFEGDSAVRIATSGGTPTRSQKPSTESDQTITQYAILSVNTATREVPPSASGRHTPYSQSPMTPLGGYAFSTEKFSTDPLLMGAMEAVKGPSFSPGSQLDIRWDQMEAGTSNEARASKAHSSGDLRVLSTLLLISAWSSWALTMPLMFKVESPTEIALVLFLIALVVPVIVIGAIVASVPQPRGNGMDDSATRSSIRISETDCHEGLARIAEMSTRSIRPDSVRGDTKWSQLFRQFPSLSKFGYRTSQSKVQGQEPDWEPVVAEHDGRPQSQRDINKRMSRPTSELWVEQGQAFSGGPFARAVNYLQANPRISVLSSHRSSGNRPLSNTTGSLRREPALGYPMEALRAASPVSSAVGSVVRSRSPLGEVPLSGDRLSTSSASTSDIDHRRETCRTAMTDSPDTKSVRNARVHTAHRAQRSHSPAYLLEGAQGELPEDLVARVRALQASSAISRPPSALLRYDDKHGVKGSESLLGRPRSTGGVARETGASQTLARDRTAVFTTRLSGLWSGEQGDAHHPDPDDGVKRDSWRKSFLPGLIPTIKVRDSLLTLKTGPQELIVEKPKSPRPSFSTFHDSIDLSTFRPSVDFVRSGSISHGKSSSLDFGQTSVDFGGSAVESTPIRTMRHRASHSRTSSLPQLDASSGPTWLQMMAPILDEYGRWIDTPIKRVQGGQTPKAKDGSIIRPRNKLSRPPMEPPIIEQAILVPQDNAEESGYSLPFFPTDLSELSMFRSPTISSTRASVGAESQTAKARTVDIEEAPFETPTRPTLDAVGALDEAAIERLDQAIECGEDEFVSGMFHDALESGDGLESGEVSFTTEAAEVMEQIMMSSGAIKAGKASTEPFTIASGKSSFPADAFPSSPRDSVAIEDMAPEPAHSHLDLDAYAAILESEEWARIPSAKVLMGKKSSDTIASRITVSSRSRESSSPVPVQTLMSGKRVGSRKGSKPPIGIHDSGRKNSVRPASVCTAPIPLTQVAAAVDALLPSRADGHASPASKHANTMDPQSKVEQLASPVSKLPEPSVARTSPVSRIASPTSGAAFPAPPSDPVILQSSTTALAAAPLKVGGLRPLRLLSEKTANERITQARSDALGFKVPNASSSRVGKIRSSTGMSLEVLDEMPMGAKVIDPNVNAVGKPVPVSILKPSRSGGNLHDRFVGNEENVPPAPPPPASPSRSDLPGNKSGKSSAPSSLTMSSVVPGNDTTTSESARAGRKKMSTGPGPGVMMHGVLGDTAGGGAGCNSRNSLEASNAKRALAAGPKGSSTKTGNGHGAKIRTVGPGGPKSGDRLGRRSTSPVKVGGGSLR